MANDRNTARMADQLKDAYVDQLSDGRRLTPSSAQNPTVLGPAETQIASEHIMLDSGHRGYINDGDGKSYIHKGGHRIEAEVPEMANPLEGGAGQKQYREMNRDEYEHFDNIFHRWDSGRYGTGTLAQSGR